MRMRMLSSIFSGYLDLDLRLPPAPPPSLKLKIPA